MKKVIPKDVDLEDVEVWFQDEARFGQQGSITRMWAIKGTRPRAVRQQQFNYSYLFGAVCPSRDIGVGLVLPYANSDTMEIHLQHISAHISKDKHCVLVLDQAGWHTSNKLQKFSNITLVCLPPASPELNPCEQIWRKLREDFLANRCFKDEEDIVQSCCEAWNSFVGEKGNIRSLCSREWSNM